VEPSKPGCISKVTSWKGNPQLFSKTDKSNTFIGILRDSYGPAKTTAQKENSLGNRSFFALLFSHE
jgi:hypothetical protein